MDYSQITPLGEIEYSDRNRIALPRGLPGFESIRYAVYYSAREYDPIKWLILEDADGAVLPLIDPYLIIGDYAPEIPDTMAEVLRADTAEDLAVMCVTTARRAQPPTINLRGPIVINVRERIAVQVILEEESLPIRYTWDAPRQEASPC